MNNIILFTRQDDLEERFFRELVSRLSSEPKHSKARPEEADFVKVVLPRRNLSMFPDACDFGAVGS
jgi:hypothetical protein